jgi:FAD/FMN-containing dehydrogenase
MSSKEGTVAERADALRSLGDRIAGDVVVQGDQGYDEARRAWNLAADLRPVAIVYPESADDVVATVGCAGEQGLRIAFVAGGHNAGTIDWSRDAVLLKTERMQGIEIDPGARRARVAAGVLAKPLAEAAGEHGLAYLAGTSPDTGVLGYTLGGGFSWMIRKYGFAANSILAAEIVTADGRHLRVDRDHEPDLFWAIRGGGGNFGAVTALELELHPVPEIYAGCLFWPIERAAEILKAWRSWIETAPVECHSIGRLLQLPDAPFLPPHLNDRSFVLVEAAFVGSEADGAALLQPLRDLGPEFDTVETIPTSTLSVVNMDPDFPLPYAGDGILLADLTPDAVDALVRDFVGSPLLHAEMRHLGGAAAAGSPEHGVLDAIAQPFIFFTFGLALDAEMAAAVEHHVEAVLHTMAPWDSGRRYLNFAESRVDPRSIFPEATYDRLLEVKARYDPDGMFLANHSLSAAR